MDKKSAVVYCRYSSQLQHETSIQRQERLAEDYCKRNNIKIAKIYYDRAVSSKRTANLEKGLGDALQYISKNKNVTHFVTENLDRVSRENPISFISKFADFLQSGIIIVESAKSEELDLKSKTMDQLRMFISQLLGSVENEKKAERVRDSYQRRKDQGIALPKIIYGYYRDNGEIKIHEEKTAIVRRIYEDFCCGKSYNRIAKSLNEEGIAPPGKTTKNEEFGKSWSAASIKRLLDNETYYTGDQNSKHGKVKGCYPPILSKKLFDKSRELIALKSSKRKTITQRMNVGKTSNLFSDILFCETCGAPIYIVCSKSREYRRYGCGEKTRGKCKNTFTFLVDDFEGIIAKELDKMLNTEDLADIIKKINTNTKKQTIILKKKETKLTEEIAKNNKIMKGMVEKLALCKAELMKTIEEGLLEKKREKQELEEELQETQEKIEEIENYTDTYLVQISDDQKALRHLIRTMGRGVTVKVSISKKKQAYAEEIVDDVEKSAEELTREARLHLKTILHRLIEKITISHKGRVKIYLRTGKLQEANLLFGSVS